MEATILAVVFAIAIGTGSALCQGGSFCTTDQGRHGFCVDEQCVEHIPDEVRNDLRFKIVVKYPETQLRQHGLPEMMYIRGIGQQGFQWLSGGPMMKTQNDTWETVVRYTSSIDGFSCHMCTAMKPIKGNKLEYRIFLDNGADMKGGTFVVNFPLSSASSYFNIAPEIVVHPWFFTDNGTVSSFDIWASHIGDERNITVYMPPSFNENSYKTYPVFIAFDVWYDVAEQTRYIFDDPINIGVASEYILVGFGDYNSSRTDWLTPSRGPGWACASGTFENLCNGCLPSLPSLNSTAEQYFEHMRGGCGIVKYQGGEGESTLDFLTTDVLRKAQQYCDNRIRLERDNVGVIGYSFGGLMACHAAWTRPHVFGMAVCQSPSLWWPRNIDKDGNTSNEFEFFNQTLRNPILWRNRPLQKIYIDVGDKENVYMIQGAVEAAKIMSSHELFMENRNLWVHVFPGDPHNLVQWTMRIWTAVSTLMPMSRRLANHVNTSNPPIVQVPLATTGVPAIPDIHLPGFVGR